MLRPTSTLIAAVLLAGLAACAGVQGPSVSGGPTGPNAEGAITVAKEQNGKFLSFVGPKIQHDRPFLGVSGTNFDCLRSYLDTRSGETANQLYVEDSYVGKKREWSAASDERGQPLRFIPISSNEITCDAGGGCSYAEEFAAALPEPLMRASTNGLMVTFTAKSGARTIIQVPGAQVVAQLAAVDSARKGLAQPTAAK